MRSEWLVDVQFLKDKYKFFLPGAVSRLRALVARVIDEPARKD